MRVSPEQPDVQNQVADRAVCVLKGVAQRQVKRRAPETRAGVDMRGLASIVTQHNLPITNFARPLTGL